MPSNKLLLSAFSELLRHGKVLYRVQKRHLLFVAFFVNHIQFSFEGNLTSPDKTTLVGEILRRISLVDMVSGYPRVQATKESTKTRTWCDDLQERRCL